ncbi:MAG: mechanosensitive ion channel domain-containing protein [Breznakibacter sp.]
MTTTNCSPIHILVALFFMLPLHTGAQDQNLEQKDSQSIYLLDQFARKIAEIEEQQFIDSIKRSELENQLNTTKTSNKQLQLELVNKIAESNRQAEALNEEKQREIQQMKSTAIGHPILDPANDTIVMIYTRFGASTPAERAHNASAKISRLSRSDFFVADSLKIIQSEYTYDIMYGELIILSLSEKDALWYDGNLKLMAGDLHAKIKLSIEKAHKEKGLPRILMRIGLILLIIVLTYLLIMLIARGYHQLLKLVDRNKEKWLKNLAYKDYTFLSAEQEFKFILFLFKIGRWLTIAIVVYITLPILFSIFPFTRDWADKLIHWIWMPFKNMFWSVWQYLPKLFSILVIYFTMKYVIRFTKYIFTEIESGKLKINGFHIDWAMPTYSIVRFLLLAFMFVLIFPYLPGSDSDIFKGVSVFIGILFSLGSSSAIANMVAGLVITYMRPFKIGDRIKIGDISGDVIEKTLLVTRVKTPKNEEITIPNSSILTGNTTNYSTYARQEGVIVHTTVTIGYDVPWKEIHQALIDAAARTEHLLEQPAPFVLQTSLDDFYVAYQINAHTKEANRLASVYSNLHQNIQDCCNERGIEILSPHYRAQRDGNCTTIPTQYLPNGYEAPSFRIKTEK